MRRSTLAAMSTLSAFATISLTLVGVLYLAGCGGADSAADEATLVTGASEGTTVPIGSGAAPLPPMPAVGRGVPDARPAAGFNGLAALGTPGEMLAWLGAERSASFSQADGHRDGAEFASLLPSNLVSAGGTALSFTPDFVPSTGLAGLAYAIYDFSLPAAQPGLLGSFSWDTDPALSNLYIGLGNFDENRWDWVVPIEITALNLAACAPYINDASDRFLMVVALTGSAEANLTEIQLVGVDPPLVELTADVSSGLVPLAVDFDGSASSDPDGVIVSWEWDFDGDGVFGEPGDESDNADVSNPAPVTYATAGSFDATLRLTDDDGASAQSAITITTNIAPTVSLEADVITGDAPLDVTFTAAAADANGSIASLEWDFDGDGNFNEAGAEQAANGDSTPPAQTYAAPGFYNVKVRATDDQGAAALDTVNILAGGPPSVTLDAIPTSGPAPLSVDFTADAFDPGGSIVDIEWDFDGDGTYNEAGNGEAAARGDATPTKVYSLSGERDAVVRVTDNDEGTATDTIHISVGNTPPTAVLTGPANAPPPFTADFDASGSTDAGGSITNYSWDLDNDGLFNEAGAEAAVEGLDAASLNITTQGSYTVTVKVTDNDGAEDTDSDTVVATGWKRLTVSTDGEETGRLNCLALINGKPAIIFHVYDSAQNPARSIRYAYSATDTGANLADWTIVTTLLTSNGGQTLSLLEVAGHPAVAYGNSGSKVCYSRSSTPAGSNPGDWVEVIADNLVNSAYGYYSLAVISGNPAIAYQGQDENTCYIRSSGTTGMSPDNWSASIVIDGALWTSGTWLSLAQIAGNPAIAYCDQETPGSIKYARANNSTGTPATAWSDAGSSKFVLATGNNASFPSLLDVNGFPGIAYLNYTGNNLSFASSSSDTGGAVGDWSFFAIDDDTGGADDTGVIPSLALINGNPAVSHQAQGAEFDLEYTRANDADGQQQADWPADSVKVDEPGDVGGYCTLKEINGFAAISYYDNTNFNLKYAILFE
jgi:PKD repeat protein